jgi:outer membrane protein OmpA-like peptidoglycan-associated protein
MMNKLIPRRFKTVALLCFIIFPVFAHAQTAGELEALLQAPALTWAQTARFVLGAADLLPAELSGPAAEQRAFEQAKENNWLPEKAEAGEAARLQGTAHLLMRSFDMRGGAMYSLLPIPRYAYREMTGRGIIQGLADPSLTYSGIRLIQIIGRTLDYTGRDFAASPRVAGTSDSSKELLEFSLAGSRGSIMGNTVLVTVPAGTDLRRLTPELSYAGFRIRPEGLRNFSRPVKYTVTAKDRSKQTYQVTVSSKIEGVENATIRETREGRIITLENIQFPADSAVLDAAEIKKLDQYSEIFRLYPERRVVITGHTALAGVDVNRQTISTDRAKLVADYFIAQGFVRQELVDAKGVGADQPLADNAAEEGRQRNRRVEILLLK